MVLHSHLHLYWLQLLSETTIHGWVFVFDIPSQWCLSVAAGARLGYLQQVHLNCLRAANLDVLICVFPFLQDNPRHYFAELVDVMKVTDECLNLCRADVEGSRGDVIEELERKLLVLSEQMHKVQQQMAQKHGKKKQIWMVLCSVMFYSQHMTELNKILNFPDPLI